MFNYVYCLNRGYYRSPKPPSRFNFLQAVKQAIRAIGNGQAKLAAGRYRDQQRWGKYHVAVKWVSMDI